MDASNQRTRPGSLAALAAGERPQERLEKLGPEALSATELLAVVLRSGTPSRDVVEVAGDLARRAGSLGGLTRMSRRDFEEIPGIGRVKALQLEAIVQIARRILEGEEPRTFDEPGKVFEYFRPLVAGLEVERFWVLVLDRKNHLLRRADITSGIADASLVHPREVFRAAIREGGSAVIAVHNHPSGDPAPSAADVRVTRQLRESARILDIDLHDHVIVGRPEADPTGTGFYSFQDAGVL